MLIIQKEFRIRVYWEDTDAGGIVFYANYLKFFERARTDWLRTLGVSQQALKEQTGGMFVVSETNLKYHQPARLDDELIVSTELLEAGRASLLLAQSARRLPCPAGSAPQNLICQGTIRIGWVSASNMKPARIPTSVLEVLK